MSINYRGNDVPNPDDRDSKRYLPKDELIGAITEIGTEVEGKPGTLTGDAICAALSDELVERYLPNPDTRADSSAANGGGKGGSCTWTSAAPRDNSPGLRHRNARVTAAAWDVDVTDTFAQDRKRAQGRHDDGPVKDGPREGTTYPAPRDVPGLGQTAWIQLSHASQEDPKPARNRTSCCPATGS